MVICPSLSLLCVFPFAFLNPICPSFCLDPSPATLDNFNISQSIKIANDNLTSALYEGHPLMSMSKVLIDTDNAFHEARWLVEASSIPSRFDLIQALKQYDENSDVVQENLSAFTAKTGSAIDHLLQHINWAVQSLTTIDAELSSPDPDFSRFPQLDQVPRPGITLRFLRFLIPSVIRSCLPFPLLWTASNTAMARFLVMQEFTLYILEITPYLAELIDLAAKLFISLDVLKTDLESIRSLILHDEQSLHFLRRSIESKRHHLARLQLFFGVPAHDVSALDEQLGSLNHISAIVQHGMKNVHGILRALQQNKADLKNLHNETTRFSLFQWRHQHSSDRGMMHQESHSIVRQADILRECAQGLRVGKEDWKRQRKIVNKAVLNLDEN